jgi:transcriptional regulator with XRE-family HTH domain
MTESQIGENLRRAREWAGMSQSQAAQLARRVSVGGATSAAGLHEQTISKYERGVIKKVPGAVLSTLAEVYGLSVGQILSGDLPAAPPTAEEDVAEMNAYYESAGFLVTLNDVIVSFEREAARRGAGDLELDLIGETLRTPSVQRLLSRSSKQVAIARIKSLIDAIHLWVESLPHPVARAAELEEEPIPAPRGKSHAEAVGEYQEVNDKRPKRA